MKVKVTEKSTGLHPSELVVEIRTNEGDQELVIDRRSLLEGGFIGIGFPVRRNGEDLLVELPRETSSGAWRVWVNKTEVQDEPERRYA